MKAVIKKLLLLFGATCAATVLLTLYASAASISSSHWAINYADFTTNMGIISATRSNFSPDAGFKRGELAKALARVEGLNPSDNVSTGFSDVAYGSSNAGEIKWAAANGIVTGYPDGTFKPNNIVSRQEYCVMLYRYFSDYKGISLPYDLSAPSFSDVSSIASWAVTAVNRLYRAEIISGFPNNTFRPTDTIDRASAACGLTKAHGYRHNSDNSINLYINSVNGGIPLEGAVMYIYRPNDGSSAMYPFTPGQAEQNGIARTIGIYSNANTEYAINVMHNDYGSIALPNKVKKSKLYVFVNLPSRTTSSLVKSPLNNFSAINTWGHTNSANCQRICPGNFTRICPDHYYNAFAPQNFGWRYGVSNNVEFHQAIDVSRNIGVPVYNPFFDTSTVIVSDNLLGRGNIVQIRDSNNTALYATYMHLVTRLVSENSTVNSRNKIGTVGNTGTSSAHLHFSLSTTSLDYTQSPSLIPKFQDPLRYFN